MKKNLLRAACLTAESCLLPGCAALLERSYSDVEPYADRYWDSGAEDTLRVESYQDLVNSLLLLVEEGAEEGVVRCYGEVGEFRSVMAAREEVRRETTLGSYLLRDLRLVHESGTSYSTVTCYITYREDAEDLASLMVLSDSQSLVDLLRLTVREERDKLTARFSYDTPREDVSAAVESFWQELCQAELEARDGEAAETSARLLPEDAPENEPDAPEESGGEEPPEDQPSEAPEGGGEEPSAGEDVSEETEDVPGGETPPEPGEPAVEYPPCPWQIKFYPDKETAEIVEVLLLS